MAGYRRVLKSRKHLLEIVRVWSHFYIVFDNKQKRSPHSPHIVRALPLRFRQRHNDAVMSFLHGRAGRMLTLALSAAWVSTVACANAQQTPAMHRHNMPCCPRDDAGTQGCSTAQCAVQAPKKTEAQSGEQVVNLLVAQAVSSDWAVTPRAEALRELTPGLRFAAADFRLKDDLRI